MPEIEKVVVVGPESTGKSTLCRLLSQHYNTLCCPEYARQYLLEQGTNYTYDDLLTIAKGQLALEEKYIKRLTNEMRPANKESPTLLFVDTDMYVMKVWCEYVFNKCHLFILDKIQEQQCSLYLLCNPDLQWVKDELREYPDLKSREELYHIYKDILINQSVPWVEIKGNYDKRFDTAMKAIDALLTSSS